MPIRRSRISAQLILPPVGGVHILFCGCRLCAIIKLLPLYTFPFSYLRQIVKEYNHGFFDTQILLHKFSNNKNSLNKSLDADIEKQDITGGQISSVVALEFLSVMEKDCNRAKMYPVKLAINHPPLPTHYRFRRKGCEIGKHRTDKIVIDFNSEFDNIVIYSNEAISQLINRKDLDGLLFLQEILIAGKII